MAHPNLQFQSNTFFLNATEYFIRPQLNLHEVTGIKRVPFVLVTSAKRVAWPRMAIVSRTFIIAGVFMVLLISHCTLKIEAINYAWPKPLRNCRERHLKEMAQELKSQLAQRKNF